MEEIENNIQIGSPEYDEGMERNDSEENQKAYENSN